MAPPAEPNAVVKDSEILIRREIIARTTVPLLERSCVKVQYQKVFHTARGWEPYLLDPRPNPISSAMWSNPIISPSIVCCSSGSMYRGV